MTTDRGRLCWRCDEPLRPDQEIEIVDVFSNSGAGAIIERHRDCPVTPPPRQTAPVGWSARTRR
ncbi:hypothetical protein [Streptomyces sp. NPDC051684]|uniref:hypothetical protein n=1 Tax=Streptomyces sp. NPDC051684 TaxID=3365670 RepID=UPI0037A5E9D5